MLAFIIATDSVGWDESIPYMSSEADSFEEDKPLWELSGTDCQSV